MIIQQHQQLIHIVNCEKTIKHEIILRTDVQIYTINEKAALSIRYCLSKRRSIIVELLQM